MTQVAIAASGLSKRYRLGQREGYRALRDVLARPFSRKLSKNGAAKEKREWIWALKDISFQIEPGDVVGIIGRNGAGKSTLLKILARITQPTEGRVDIRGRVGSLLEVGTGFHPELTGRENIYLNGAILGMRRAETDRKFDEIVAFSEIEKFLDTPVKHYSSGMYIRLAFAVAAHLEPEILLVDEVLAVGDAAFQKKCLGKMSDVARGGRTVITVSHQMNSIRRLCNQVLWIEKGEIVAAGPCAKTVSAYEAAVAKQMTLDPQREEQAATSPAQFLRWEIVEPRDESPHAISRFGPIKMKVTVRINQPVRGGHHGVSLRDIDNQLMWGWAIDIASIEPGIHEFIYTLPGLPLRPGAYGLHLSLYSQKQLLWDEWHCVPNLIIATPPVAHPSDDWCGILNIPCEFGIQTEKIFGP